LKGIINLYYGFRHHLYARRRKIGVLQRLGRLEEYLTKEFAGFVYVESKMSILPLTNLGVQGEQKIDISLLEGDFSKGITKQKARIRAFVEVKYLRNLHRVGPHSAEDEIRATLVDLHRQLRQFDKGEHAGYQVELRGRRKDIYGMVFASYVHDAEKDNDERRFLKRINQCGLDLGFRYHDLPSPALRKAYSEQRVVILRREMRASLHVGLWPSCVAVML